MGFDNVWVQSFLTVGIVLLVWFGALAFFFIAFAIMGEHIRRQRTDDPDDDWFK